MRTPTIIVAALALTMLGACARDITPAADGASAPPGDTAASSDMVTPVGGDLRVGQPWYLVGTSLSSVMMPEGVTITFEDKTVGGRAPVNSWSADYTVTARGGLELGPIASTLMAGPDEAMRAEEAYFALLETVDGYTAVEAGELYLFDDQAQVLTFSTTQQPSEPQISDATLAVAQDVIGMTEKKAQSTVEAAGLTYRVVSRDGEGLAVTDDYSVVRVNATIVDGEVTETYVG
jgi:heat shock protein HslJ